MIVGMQLDREERRRIATGIEHALERAEQPATSISPQIAVRREAVEEARGELLEIVERLRMPAPIHEEGLRLAHTIVTDGTGPLYSPAPDGTMRDLANRTLRALDDASAR